MKIDVTSMFFNSKIEGQTATPAWGTSIGQNKSRECRIDDHKQEIVDMVIGMTYMSVSDINKLDISKGSSDRDLITCAVFKDIFINNNKIENAQYTLLLVREHSKSHDGRLLISYAPYIKYGDFSNSDCIELMRIALGCSPNGCWFVYDISIINQSELHFNAVVVNPNEPMIYSNSIKSRNRSEEWKSLIPKDSDYEDTSYTPRYPLQQIFYGAPGTSKSHTVKKLVDDKNEIHFRTTFHPDSDYSTFVGCYKPRSHKKNILSGNGINETQLLSSFFNSNGVEYKGKNKARYLYEALVHTKDIRDLGLDAQMVSDKLNAQGFSGCAYTTEATCMYNIYDWLKEDGYIVENKLTYEFTPQAFVNAYVEAWRQQKSGTPVYLIIEEINRGNCAQIFGDLFQLLDRDDNGFSRYEVTPDSDLQDYIASLGLNISDIVDRNGNDISSMISKGKLLKLPDNFFIWATMNTSDQSLFPIDSAFKRRWDWKYMPIEDAAMNWEIHVNGNIYNWYDFLVAINKEVLTLTHSEDKQLGYFFAKAKNNIIDAETLVNKVYFYLWTDVFKDYDYESQKAFRKPNSNDPIAFKDFFNGREVNEEMAEQVLINLDFKKPEVNAE